MRNITFRCAKCQATTKAQVAAQPGTFAKIACSNCAGTYLLEAEPLGDVSDEEYAARVRAYATAQNIDAASACSVLEGIMLRENVRSLPVAAVVAPRAAAAESSSFRGSVLVGLLVLFCAFFAGRSMGGRGSASNTASKATSAVMSAGPALPAMVPAGKSAWITSQVDDARALTKLSGPDPRTVFEALLDRPEYGGNLVPYGFSSANGGGLESKLGVARDRMDPTQMYSVRVWGDKQGRWTIGDGRGPVRLEAIQSLPGGFETF